MELFQCTKRFRNNNSPEFTDVEVATVSLWGILSGLQGHKTIHTNTERYLKEWFPKSDDLWHSVFAFVSTYLGIIAIGTLILDFDANDRITSLTAVMTCVAGAGPGFGMVGPTDNFAHFSDLVKIILSVIMLLGRLEFFVLLSLRHRKFWVR
ncbi:potassium transporter TrkG [Deltaproteobacteria bacterium TL4]